MKLIYIIIIIAFIDTFSQLPIIAPYSIGLGATPIVVGLVIGMYSFSNILGNIFSGIWIDKIGPKRILAFGMFFAAFVLVFYNMVNSPSQLLIVRFLHGIAGGLIVPAAFTLLSSYGKEAPKGKKMAYSGAAVGVAAIAGPAFGAIISSRLGYEWLFYSVAFFMAVFGMLAVLFVKEMSKRDTKEDYQEVDNRPGDASIVKNKKILHAYLSIFLLLFSLGIVTYSLPLKVDELSIRPEMTGILLSVFGIVAIFFFILPTNRMYDQVKKSILMNIGLLFVALSLFFLYLANSLIVLFLAMSIYGIGFSFLFPSTSSTVIECSGEQRRGKAFGIFYACFSFGVITGSFIAGAISMPVSYSFLLGAIILLGVLGVLLIENRVRRL